MGLLFLLLKAQLTTKVATCFLDLIHTFGGNSMLQTSGGLSYVFFNKRHLSCTISNRLRWKVQVLTLGVFGFMEFLISFSFSRATVDEQICNHQEWYENMPVEQVIVIIPLHDTMPKSSMSHVTLCFVECFHLVPQKHV